MQSIEKMLNDGTLDSITKKERLTLTRDREKMEKVLGGIAQISRIPAALFIVDIGHEHIALSEARRLNITTFGMVDTNCDPNKVEFAIPANDDATKSIAIITNYIVAAVAEGLAERQAEKDEETEENPDDRASDAIKFDLSSDEEKDRRRGSTPAGGKGRGPAGPQKRRIAGTGAGGNRAGGPGGRR
jgi:small subunit ribosomal protein S2